MLLAHVDLLAGLRTRLTAASHAGVSDHDLMFSKKAEDNGTHRGEHWPEPIDSRQTARPPPTSAVRQRMTHASGEHINNRLLLCVGCMQDVDHMCNGCIGCLHTAHVTGPPAKGCNVS